VRQYQIIGVSVGVGRKADGNLLRQQTVRTVNVGRHQTVGQRGAGEAIAAVVSISGLLSLLAIEMLHSVK
jgi:hypothetical protein